MTFEEFVKIGMKFTMHMNLGDYHVMAYWNEKHSIGMQQLSAKNKRGIRKLGGKTKCVFLVWDPAKKEPSEHTSLEAAYKEFNARTTETLDENHNRIN